MSLARASSTRGLPNGAVSVEREHRIVAAAFLHRFRIDGDVSDTYRGVGDVRWLVCHVDAITDRACAPRDRPGIEAPLGLKAVGADCALPAPGCYGIPDTMRTRERCSPSRASASRPS